MHGNTIIYQDIISNKNILPHDQGHGCWTVPALCDNILPYIKEGIPVAKPLLVSLMFSMQTTHISLPFWLLHQFHWYKVYVLCTIYVKKVEVIIDAWLTWVEKPPPANCRLVVPIMVCQVHQNRNRRGLIHTELNSICIRHLELYLWWTCNTTIGTTSLQFAGDGFSTQVSHASIITSKNFFLART